MSFYSRRRDYRNYNDRDNNARRDYATAPILQVPMAIFTAPKWVAYKEVQPVRAAWIEAKAATFDFADAMYAAVIRYGDLTQGQNDAVDRCVARDAQRASQRASEPSYNNGLDCRAVRAAFETFLRAGQRKPKIVVEGFELSLAPSTGKNPGAIYVKDNGQYVGKIVSSTESFTPGRDFNPARMEALQAVFRDPRAAVQAEAARIAARIAAAQAAGQSIDVPCGCCGILLTDPVSRARGIGPICAGKWGF